MSEPQAGDDASRFTVKLTSDSHFAWLRTRMALDRTMMAWTRTAVSLIGFGFVIVQFFDTLQDVPGAVPPRFPDAPRYLGLGLILCGILALVLSLLEYRFMRRHLWSGSFAELAGKTHLARRAPLYLAAGTLILVGLFAFFAVLLRLT